MEATRLIAASARNNAWANYRLYRACAALRPAEVSQARVSFFPSILETLAHILLVDGYYLAMLQREGEGAFERDQAKLVSLGFAALKAAQQDFDRRLIEFCDALTGPDLDREVVLLRGGGQRFCETAAAVLLHLFEHDIHHRGQVHAMLAGSSVAPPQLDEFFLESDAPLRRDDFAALGWSEDRRW